MISGVDWARVRAAFDRASELDAAERERFIAELQDEPDLMAQVRALLAEADQGSGFLSRPIADWSDVLPSHMISDDHLIGHRLGDYEILATIGRGGMGVVYRAQQSNPRRTVAIKVIRAASTTREHLKRFRYEAEALARLKHPGIAQVFEAGTAIGPDGRQLPFLAMELVVGKPLLRWFEENKPSIGESLRLCALICDAVQHAHERGVIHRDLKPANILIEPSHAPSSSVVHSSVVPASMMQPKVLDFGVARLSRGSEDDGPMTTARTDAGQIVGTLAYMSPEQSRGDQSAVDTRSDIYSLGVIMYEVLTGRLPHQLKSTNVAEAARIVNEVAPPPPSRYTPALRGDVETIILKSLEHDPNRRYSSAAELAADIHRFLEDLPIIARPASTRYQLQKFAARNRSLVAALAVCLALLFLGTAGTLIGLLRAVEAQKLAERRADQVADENRKAERAIRFLTDVIGASSSENLPHDATLHDTLMEALTRIERDLGSEPSVAAVVREKLGAGFLRLGDLMLARPNAEKALAHWLEVTDSQSKEAGRLYTLLGAISMAEGEFDQAENYLTKSLAVSRATVGPQHVDSIQGMVDLASAMVSLERYEEAEELAKEAIASLDAIREGGARRQWAMGVLSRVYVMTDRKERAEQILRDILAHVSARYGSDDPYIATTQVRLASLLSEQGKQEEALALLKNALHIRERMFGQSHSRTLSARRELGELQLEMKDVAGSIEALTAVLRERRRTLRADHPEVLRTLSSLASSLVYARSFDEAEILLREVVHHRSQRSPVAMSTCTALSNLASCLSRKGEIVDACVLYSQASEARWAASDSSLSAARMYGMLADSLIRLGRDEEALPWSDRARSITLAKAPGSTRSVDAQLRSARLAMKLGFKAEAEYHVMQALPVMGSWDASAFELLTGIIQAGPLTHQSIAGPTTP